MIMMEVPLYFESVDNAFRCFDVGDLDVITVLPLMTPYEARTVLP